MILKNVWGFSVIVLLSFSLSYHGYLLNVGSQNSVLQESSISLVSTTLLYNETLGISEDFVIDTMGNIFLTDQITSQADNDVRLSAYTLSNTRYWVRTIGGTNGDWGKLVMIDYEQNIIVAGETASTDFPVLNTDNLSMGGVLDICIVKFAPNGSILWATRLGGTNSDGINGMTIDSNNNIILTGNTQSEDFPLSSNPFQSYNSGVDDCFVLKMAKNGSLIWSTYLGGSSHDYGSKVTTDAAGNVYLAGHTWSTDFPFIDGSELRQGRYDVFVTKFLPNGSLIWSEFLGGKEDDYGYAIECDLFGNIFVAGLSFSADFPQLNNNISIPNPSSGNLFISKISSENEVCWSCFVGGDEWDQVNDILVDNWGNIYATGYTYSLDFPLLKAVDFDFTCQNGICQEGFIMKYSPFGVLLWSSLLGGDARDEGMRIQLLNESFIVIGATQSTDFPLAPQPAIISNEYVFISIFQEINKTSGMMSIQTSSTHSMFTSSSLSSEPYLTVGFPSFFPILGLVFLSLLKIRCRNED